MVQFCFFFVHIFYCSFSFFSVPLQLFSCFPVKCCSHFSALFLFFIQFIPVTVDGEVLPLFATFFWSGPFCFFSSTVFLLFSCQMLNSFLCLVLVFLLYFVSVTVNSRVSSLFCQLFWPLFLSFLFLSVFLSNVALISLSCSCFSITFRSCYCKW